MSNESKIGDLTDEEKVEALFINELLEQIQKLQKQYTAHKKKFWSGIEIRLDRYESKMRFDSTTGEIFVIEDEEEESFNPIIELLKRFGSEE